jgi:hypothetical protein
VSNDADSINYEDCFETMAMLGDIANKEGARGRSNAARCYQSRHDDHVIEARATHHVDPSIYLHVYLKQAGGGRVYIGRPNLHVLADPTIIELAVVIIAISTSLSLTLVAKISGDQELSRAFAPSNPSPYTLHDHCRQPA